jgi:hypothetical protein
MSKKPSTKLLLLAKDQSLLLVDSDKLERMIRGIASHRIAKARKKIYKKYKRKGKVSPMDM